MESSACQNTTVLRQCFDANANVRSPQFGQRRTLEPNAGGGDYSCVPSITAARPTPEERASQLATEAAALKSRMRRWWATRILGIFGSCAVGLVLVAYSLHTTNERWAGVLFWAGLLLGNCGMFLTLLVTALQANDEGLW